MFVISGLAFLAGCTPLSEQLIYGTGDVGWKEALSNLDSSNIEERLYIARDLKSVFVTETNDLYRIRAVYGLLRISVLQVKDDDPESSLEILAFLYTKSMFSKASEGLGDNVTNKTSVQFLNTLAVVLPGAVKLRKTGEWQLMYDFYITLKKKYKASENKYQVYVIREAHALNDLEKAYEDSSYRGILLAAKNNPGTRSSQLARKMALIIQKEKLKSKNIEEKYLILNSEKLPGLFSEQKQAIEKLIYELGPKTVK